MNSEFDSHLEWKGLHSQKFHYKQKAHLTVPNALSGFQGGEYLPLRGRQHFEPQHGKATSWRPQLKVDVQRPLEGNTVEFPPGKLLIDIKHQPKKERPQMKHLQEGKSGHLEDIPYGIRAFSHSSGLGKPYNVEEMMGSKNRVGGLEDMRNHLKMATLGDKPYGHPDYSKEFFKGGGLIPGANIAQRKININQLQDKEMEDKLKMVSQKIPKGMKWTDKVKNDARKLDQDAIDELEIWVEQTLKEANPNYRDPDMFFENLEKEKASGKQPTGKDSKKMAKK